MLCYHERFYFYFFLKHKFIFKIIIHVFQGKRVSFQHQGTFDSSPPSIDSAPSSIDSAYASSQFLDTSHPSTFIQEKKSPAVVKTDGNKNVGDPKTPQNEENPQSEKMRQNTGPGFTRNVGKAEQEHETNVLVNVGTRQEPRRRSMLAHIPDTSFSLANQQSPILREVTKKNFSHSNNPPFTAGLIILLGLFKIKENQI